ncbi:tyrosine-protein kinase [Nibrella saemangeumensis]|uniref:Tyrosine-protein kinase n=1 Tax=Nibrella saemangeumensis TaxID=1084526 RepID=A0ABP8N1W0_9BACT
MSTNNYPYTQYQVYDLDDTINVRTIVMRYLKYWPWFVLSLVTALTAAYVYLLYQPPIYKVQAELLIKDEMKGMYGRSVMEELDNFAPKKVVENEVLVLKTYSLMDKVVNRLGLDVHYYQPTRFRDQEIYDASPIRLLVEKPLPSLYSTLLTVSFTNTNTIRINDVTYPVNQSILTPYGKLRIFTRQSISAKIEPIKIWVMPRASAVNSYVGRLNVEPANKTATVLVLSLEDEVPEKGQAVLNQLIEEYNQAAVVDKNRVASNTLKFIEDRLGLISGELSSVEKDVELFKSREGISDLGQQSNAFLQTIQRNDQKLNEVDIQLSSLSDIERYIHSRGDGQGITPATLGVSDPLLLGLLTKLTDLELQRSQLARTTHENNPILLSLDTQISNTKKSISENIQTMKQVLTSNRQQLTAVSRHLEGQIRSIPKKERALLDITRQQSIKNNLYTYLLQKREETALSYASAVSDSRVIDIPRAIGPIKPVRRNIFAVFGLFGLLFPIGLLTLRNVIKNRVLQRSDVEDVTQVPILGEIVENKSKEAMVVMPRSRSVIAEQIRTLRTNLQFLRSNEDTSQVLLFTSSISGEGKSFLSMNLGASLALVDQPTVILEMDLRKPKLHTSLGMHNNLGISNYLIGEATLDEILQPVGSYDNYWIITSGPIPPNPAELLANTRLQKLITELRERFAYVIIDSPPIGLVTDAQLIAKYADATLFMVRHDHTPKNCLKMIDLLYKEQRFQKLTVILNGVGGGDSYYYSSNYGYYNDGPEVGSKKSLLKKR